MYLQEGGAIYFVLHFLLRNFNAKKAQQQIGIDIIPTLYAMPISSYSDIEVKFKQLLSLMFA